MPTDDAFTAHPEALAELARVLTGLAAELDQTRAPTDGDLGDLGLVTVVARAGVAWRAQADELAGALGAAAQQLGQAAGHYATLEAGQRAAVRRQVD